MTLPGSKGPTAEDDIDPRSADFKWAWEIHKNCDSLLHQRLASFTAAQAMTLAAFTLLTIARFQATAPMGPRLQLLEYGRLSVAAFGFIMAIFGWLVTYPMFERLSDLNDLLTQDPIYSRYIKAADTKLRVPFVRIDFPMRTYKLVIPLFLPLTELALWITLITLTIIGISRTPATGA